MLCKVRFSEYEYRWQKEPRERLHKFLSLKGIPFTLELDKEINAEGKEREIEPNVSFFKEEHLFDIVELAKSGLKFDVMSSGQEIETTYMVRVASMLEKLIDDGPQKSQQQIVNIKYDQSHDTFLSQVNEVDVMEDCCTDDLRRGIERGWRIIAVCYQKGNRRPDYVLGRTSVMKPPPVVEEGPF